MVETGHDTFWADKRRMIDEATALGAGVRFSQDGDKTRGEIRWPDDTRFWVRGTTEDVVAELQKEVDRVRG